LIGNQNTRDFKIKYTKLTKKILGKSYVGMLHISNTQQSAQIPLEDIGMHVTSVQKNMWLEAFHSCRPWGFEPWPSIHGEYVGK
jgi:hypothetical protein